MLFDVVCLPNGVAIEAVNCLKSYDFGGIVQSWRDFHVRTLRRMSKIKII